MVKVKKEEEKKFKSFEQWQSETFPKLKPYENSAARKDIENIAICLADESFNKLLVRNDKA